jgi:hypothetical protein
VLGVLLGVLLGSDEGDCEPHPAAAITSTTADNDRNIFLMLHE